MSQSDIRTKIRNGFYTVSALLRLAENQFPRCCIKNSKLSNMFCPECGANIQAVKDAQKKITQEYRNEENRLFQLFKTDALESVNLSTHPKSDIIFDRACDKGHSCGYESVLDELDDLVSFLNSLK